MRHFEQIWTTQVKISLLVVKVSRAQLPKFWISSIKGQCAHSRRSSNFSHCIIVDDFYTTHGCLHRHQTPPQPFDSPIHGKAIINRKIFFRKLPLVSSLLQSRILKYSRQFSATVERYQFLIRMRHIWTTVIPKPLAGKEQLYSVDDPLYTVFVFIELNWNTREPTCR